jgi:hypothetical protein
MSCRLSLLQPFESESVHILREVAAEFSRPAKLYSMVMLRLAQKASSRPKFLLRFSISRLLISFGKRLNFASASVLSMASALSCILRTRNSQRGQPIQGAKNTRWCGFSQGRPQKIPDRVANRCFRSNRIVVVQKWACGKRQKPVLD